MLKKFLGVFTAALIGLTALTADARNWTGSVFNHGYQGGYVFTGGTYSSISTKIKLPQWQYGPNNATYSPGFGSGVETTIIWVGIGGWGDSLLIQAGPQIYTTHDPGTGFFKVTFDWYQRVGVDANSVPVGPNPGPPPYAGDEMFVSLTCTANCSPATTQTWQVVIKDLTRGLVIYNSSLSYQSSMASAEFAVETPFDGSVFIPNVQFTPITFTDMMVNGAKANPNPSATQILMNSSSRGMYTTPSFPNGNSFNACWSYGAPTYCPSPKNPSPNVRNPNP